ncbi:MAG: dipeptidase PepE [Bacteroidetes bacterium]|nr:dipeptidase PepE [Bacteroidota bacterium]
MPRLLLLSNSMNPGDSYLNHSRKWISHFFGSGTKTIAFIPWAGVTLSYKDYCYKVRTALEPMGYRIVSVHEVPGPAALIHDSDAIAIGGGNTFKLLKMLQDHKLTEVIRNEVLVGKPFLGWSAGSNVAAPSIRTTNDMPIVQPQSFEALNLIPFQINPHYLDLQPELHMGETREQRLLEFVSENPAVYVTGLREGSALSIDGDKIELLGQNPVRIFKKGVNPHEVNPGESLSFLFG